MRTWIRGCWRPPGPCPAIPRLGHGPSAGRRCLLGTAVVLYMPWAILSQREQIDQGWKWGWQNQGAELTRGGVILVRAVPKAVGSLERLGPAVTGGVPAGAGQLHSQDHTGAKPCLGLMTPEEPLSGG